MSEPTDPVDHDRDDTLDDDDPTGSHTREGLVSVASVDLYEIRRSVRKVARLQAEEKEERAAERTTRALERVEQLQMHKDSLTVQQRIQETLAELASRVSLPQRVADRCAGIIERALQPDVLPHLVTAIKWTTPPVVLVVALLMGSSVERTPNGGWRINGALRQAATATGMAEPADTGLRREDLPATSSGEPRSSP